MDVTMLAQQRRADVETYFQMLGHNLSRILQVQPATCAPSFWRPDPSAVSFDLQREIVDDEACEIPMTLSLLNRTKEARFDWSFACLKPCMACGQLLQQQPAERQIEDARHGILRDIVKHWPMDRSPLHCLATWNLLEASAHTASSP